MVEDLEGSKVACGNKSCNLSAVGRGFHCDAFRLGIREDVANVLRKHESYERHEFLKWIYAHCQNLFGWLRPGAPEGK